MTAKKSTAAKPAAAKSAAAATNKAATTAVDTTNVPLSAVPGGADTRDLEQDQLKPATDVAASGALIEPEIVDRIDTAHPAVDDAPRAGQPKVANQIDFNDPMLSSAEAVEKSLAAQADS